MAHEGVDILDLFRPGSTLTFRKLSLHIRSLPASAPLRAVLQEAEKNAYKKPDLIRARQAEFERRNAERLAREAENE